MALVSPRLDKQFPESITLLAPDFYLVKGSNDARFPFSNAFLFTGKQTVLIDAGLDKEIIREIDRIRPIDILMISHSHPDHILNWAQLADRTLMFPEQTPDSVHDLKSLGKRFMDSASNGLIWADIVKNQLGIDALRVPDKRFSDGDILDFEPFRLQAIYARGHLGDHYCFFEHTTGILLTSDIDFSSFGPFYGQAECSIDQFKQTIAQLRQIPCKMACSSHRDPISENIDQAFESFLQGFERHAKIFWDLCKTPCTIDRMVEISPLYHNKMLFRIFQQTFERGMIQKSIDMMIKRGQIIQTENGYLAIEN